MLNIWVLKKSKIDFMTYDPCLIKKTIKFSDVLLFRAVWARRVCKKSDSKSSFQEDLAILEATSLLRQNVQISYKWRTVIFFWRLSHKQNRPAARIS